jgi:hypothetical protein
MNLIYTKKVTDRVFTVREPDLATCEANGIGYVPSVNPFGRRLRRVTPPM